MERVTGIDPQFVSLGTAQVGGLGGPEQPLRVPRVAPTDLLRTGCVAHVWPAPLVVRWRTRLRRLLNGLNVRAGHEACARTLGQFPPFVPPRQSDARPHLRQ
jgi:hypothetical protein